MLRSFVLAHHRKVDGQAIAGAFPSSWLEWETCLRQLAFGFTNATDSAVFAPEWELYEGGEAYRLLLEIICGLHSPIKGETEVLGQFRTEAERFQQKNPEAKVFAKLFAQLFRDAKLVRERFLKGVGSRSYGSVARRELRGVSQVCILGSGQLAEQILPWICEEKRAISMLCRSPERALHFAQKFSGLEVRRIADFSGDESSAGRRALLVAAPMTAEEITFVAQKFGRNDILLDFRADSELDRVAFHGDAITLTKVFAALSAGEIEADERVNQARIAIDGIVLRHRERVEHRPFGWEDVCA